MTFDLFERPAVDGREKLGRQAVVLRSFALAQADALLSAISGIEGVSPFRHMETPGGFPMSVALTNAGALGWVSDRRGYRYTAVDPGSGDPWPPIPRAFQAIAHDAAASAGFADFVPDRSPCTMKSASLPRVALDVEEVRVWEPLFGWTTWEPVDQSMRCGSELVFQVHDVGWFETADTHMRLRAPDPVN
jgi:hypothetical protein